MFCGNQLCMVCKDRQRSPKLEQLRRLDGYLRRVFSCTTGVMSLDYQNLCSPNWGLHHKCKSGMRCQDLSKMESECKRLATALEPKLAHIALYGNDALYCETLQYLRGYFPAVYKWMEFVRCRGAY